MYIQRNGSGDVVGLSRWPKFAEQESLSSDHSDVQGYYLGQAKKFALMAVKDAARGILNDIDFNVSKADLLAAVTPFKTQFQNATTPEEVEQIKTAALVALEGV